MSKQITPKEAAQQFRQEAQTLWDEFDQWMDTHPQATLKEIEQHLRPLRRRFMGQTIALQLQKRGAGVQEDLPTCPHCGQPMEYKGLPDKPAVGLEFEGRLPHAYYHCSRCGEGFPPPSAPSWGCRRRRPGLSGSKRRRVSWPSPPPPTKLRRSGSIA